ncbi:MAG: hypothetical protein GY754_15505 [bacterium]|nr:hypothetical protein [bacterium]
MIATILLLLLIGSFSTHLLFVILYVAQRSKKSFNGFVITGGSNVLIMISLSIVAMSKPEFIQEIDLAFILWVTSGIVMCGTLILKINVFRKVHKRTKDPNFYHMNHFGKKVYKEDLVKKSEFLTMILSIPFFLLIGAYFVAKLINWILTGVF